MPVDLCVYVWCVQKVYRLIPIKYMPLYPMVHRRPGENVLKQVFILLGKKNKEIKIDPRYQEIIECNAKGRYIEKCYNCPEALKNICNYYENKKAIDARKFFDT